MSLQLPLGSQDCSPKFPRCLIQNEIMPAGDSCSGTWEMEDLEKGCRLLSLKKQG